MKIDFLPVLTDSKTIKLYDISPLGQQLPLNIWNMYLRIKCSKLENGGPTNTFDIINYLKTQRLQTECFTITSSLLGLGNTEVLPDGVYHLYITINDVMEKHIIFVIYKTIDEAINNLLTTTSYQVNINNYDITYVGDSVDVNYNLETVRLAVSLRDTLILAAIQQNEVLANDTLDKLQRILGIII
jgi:hypothetical protein